MTGRIDTHDAERHTNWVKLVSYLVQEKNARNRIDKHELFLFIYSNSFYLDYYKHIKH